MKRLFYYSLIFILILTGFFIFKSSGLGENSSLLSQSTESNITAVSASQSNSAWDMNQVHQVRFFEQELFLRGLEDLSANQVQLPSDKIIRGGVVPHHLLASGILARFFSYIGAANPPVIVVIGPNHEEVGYFPILTSQFAWDTPFGQVHPDLATISILEKSSLVSTDENILPSDHSVSGMIPYIKHFSPESSIIPLLVSNKLTSDEINEFSELLVASLPSNALVIAAVDFSHYLSSDQAEAKDQETIAVIKNRDYDKLLSFGNDNLDAPASIALLLMTMDRLGVSQLEVLENTNSGRLLNTPQTETTSYFSIILTE